MPLAFAFIGIIVLVTAIQGTYAQFFQLLSSDLIGSVPTPQQSGGITGFAAGITGGKSFVVWLGAILLIGLIGYVPGGKTISRSLLALVLLVLLLGNGKSAFPNFVAAFKSPGAPVPSQPVQQSAVGPFPVVFSQAGGAGAGGLPTAAAGQAAPATTAAAVGTGGLF